MGNIKREEPSPRACGELRISHSPAWLVPPASPAPPARHLEGAFSNNGDYALEDDARGDDAEAGDWLDDTSYGDGARDAETLSESDASMDAWIADNFDSDEVLHARHSKRGCSRRCITAILPVNVLQLRTIMNWWPLKFREAKLEDDYVRTCRGFFHSQPSRIAVLTVWYLVGLGVIAYSFLLRRRRAFLNHHPDHGFVWPDPDTHYKLLVTVGVLRVLQVALMTCIWVACFWRAPRCRSRPDVFGWLVRMLSNGSGIVGYVVLVAAIEWAINVILYKSYDRSDGRWVYLMAFEMTETMWTSGYALVLINGSLSILQRVALNYSLLLWVVFIKMQVFTHKPGTPLLYSRTSQAAQLSLHVGQAALLVMSCVAKYIQELADRVSFISSMQINHTIDRYAALPSSYNSSPAEVLLAKLDQVGRILQFSHDKYHYKRSVALRLLNVQKYLKKSEDTLRSAIMQVGMAVELEQMSPSERHVVEALIIQKGLRLKQRVRLTRSIAHRQLTTGCDVGPISDLRSFRLTGFEGWNPNNPLRVVYHWTAADCAAYLDTPQLDPVNLQSPFSEELVASIQLPPNVGLTPLSSSCHGTQILLESVRAICICCPILAPHFTSLSHLAVLIACSTPQNPYNNCWSAAAGTKVLLALMHRFEVLKLLPCAELLGVVVVSLGRSIGHSGFPQDELMMWSTNNRLSILYNDMMVRARLIAYVCWRLAQIVGLDIELLNRAPPDMETDSSECDPKTMLDTIFSTAQCLSAEQHYSTTAQYRIRADAGDYSAEKPHDRRLLVDVLFRASRLIKEWSPEPTKPLMHIAFRHESALQKFAEEQARLQADVSESDTVLGKLKPLLSSTGFLHELRWANTLASTLPRPDTRRNTMSPSASSVVESNVGLRRRSSESLSTQRGSSMTIAPADARNMCLSAEHEKAYRAVIVVPIFDALIANDPRKEFEKDFGATVLSQEQYREASYDALVQVMAGIPSAGTEYPLRVWNAAMNSKSPTEFLQHSQRSWLRQFESNAATPDCIMFAVKPLETVSSVSQESDYLAK